jgi:hypothetical protein
MQDKSAVNVKENTVSLKQTFRGGKNRTRKLKMPFVHDNYSVALKVFAFMKLKKRFYKFVWTVRQNEVPVLCDIITLKA